MGVNSLNENSKMKYTLKLGYGGVTLLSEYFFLNKENKKG